MANPPPYASISYAESYFNRRLHVAPWASASPADKMKALIMSSDAIDRLNFVGAKTDPNQERCFPRDYNPGSLSLCGTAEVFPTNVLPDDILKATCENALALLDGVDPEVEYANTKKSKVSFGGVSSQYIPDVTKPHVLCGIASFVAFKYIRPYMEDLNKISLVRSS